MKKTNKLFIDRILYFAIVFVIGVLFVFFYRRFIVYSYDIDYHTIFTKYLFEKSMAEISQIDKSIPVHAISYPLYHILLKVVAIILKGNYFWATYFVLAGANVLSILLFRQLLFLIYKTEKPAERIGLNFLSIAAIFFVVARSPLTDWRFYAKQCAANPLHNPTILFVRPFGILAMIAFALIFIKKEKELRYGKELTLFGVSMFLSILAKPNFAFVFLPAMGLVTLIYMIQKKNLKLGMQLLGAVIPSGILLVTQFVYLSLNTEAVETKIVFGGFTGLQPLEVFMASLATFPVVIIFFSIKEFKNNVFYRVSILALLIGWVQMFFLTNGPSGDFSWGYDLAVQFATIISIVCAMKSGRNRWVRYIGYLVFGYQVFCGIQYIILVNGNGLFRI